MARLVILSEGMTGKAHELTVDKTTIGRVDDNMFPIPEASFPAIIAKSCCAGSDVVVRDLNSTNGTFINGHQVTGEAALKPGQILRLGPGGNAPGRRRRRGRPEKPASAAQEIARSNDGHSARRQARPGTFDQAVTFDKSAFAKKSNTGTKIFIGVVVVVSCGHSDPAGGDRNKARASFRRSKSAFLQPARRFRCRISDDKIRPGPSHRQQCFQRHRPFVNPALRRRGLDHRIFAADRIGRRGIAKLRFDPMQNSR